MRRKIIYLLPILALVLSCEEIILEDDISDETVNLVAPADGAEFFSTGITFTWDPIENGTQYRIEIARPDFENPLQIVADNIVDTTSFTTQLNVGEYQWRVQGVNSGYATVFSTRSFTVVSNDNFQDNTVSLTSPGNNLVTNQSQQTLVWQPVLGASGYNVQIVDTDSNIVISDEQTEATSYTYTFPEGNYQWKVRATNGEQNTLFAARSILVDTIQPNTPQLSVPADLSFVSDATVTFEWNRNPIAGSAEKDSLYIYNDSALSNLEYKNLETSPYETATLDNGTYYWYVKSFDAAGNASAQSNVFSFTLN